MAKTKTQHKARITQPPAPVTVTRLAATACGRCGEPVSYRPEPGAASAALTGHYGQAHRDLATA